MAVQFKVDPTTIEGRYQAFQDSTVQNRLKKSLSSEDLSKQFKTIEESQQKLYDAVVVLMKDLFTTQRSNIELADSKFATVLLNNLSKEQLDSLSRALEDKYDEIIKQIESKVKIALDIPKDGIDLSSVAKLSSNIDEIFKNLKKKLSRIQIPKKISPREYKNEVNSKIDAKVKFLDIAVSSMSKNYSQILTSFTKANASLNFISKIKFSQNIDNLLKPKANSIPINFGNVKDVGDYFLLNKNVKSILGDMLSLQLTAVEEYDVENPLEKIDERAAKRLALSRVELGNSIKRLFFVSFVADFVLAPIRFFKKAKSIVGSIGSSIAAMFGNLKWTNPLKMAGAVIGVVFSAIGNVIAFRLTVYKEIAGILLTPVKRLTRLTLNFATFLAKKAVRVVKYTLRGVVSILNKLLMPKLALRSALAFFRTPLGATILGFVVGKIYLFGKSVYTAIRDKVASAIDFVRKSYDEFSEWFAETKLGHWLSGIDSAIDSAGGFLGFLEQNGKYVLEIADKIMHVDVFWILQDIEGKIGDFLGGMLGGGLGSLIGGAVRLVGGPIGSIVGSLIGSLLGESFGRWFSGRLTGYFKKTENRSSAFMEAISLANLGTKVTSRITTDYNGNSVVVHEIADQLLKRLNKMDENDAGRNAVLQQLDYVRSVESLRQREFQKSGGKFSAFNRQYEALNKDTVSGKRKKDGSGEETEEKEALDTKIDRLAINVRNEINAINQKDLEKEIKKSEISKLLKESFVQYDFYDKEKELPKYLKTAILHPYKFRFMRALFLEDLIAQYKTSNLPAELFVKYYNELSNPNSTFYDWIVAERGAIGRSGFMYSITAKQYYDASELNKKDNDPIVRGAAFVNNLTRKELEAATKTSFFKVSSLNEMLDKLSRLEGYSSIKERFESLEKAANFGEKQSELKTVGISDELVEKSSDRLREYLFFLLSNASKDTTNDDIVDFFNKTWAYELGEMLNTKEFGDSKSKTLYRSLLERQSTKHVVSEDLLKQIEDGTISSLRDLLETAPGKDQTSNQGSNQTIQAVEKAIDSIDSAVSTIREKYEEYSGPENEAKLHRKVNEIVEKLKSWHDRNVYPILWKGNPNLANPYGNPTAVDAR